MPTHTHSRIHFSLARKKLKQTVPAFIVVVGLIVLGIHLIASSHAASPYTSTDATTGSLAGSATICPSTGSSSGNAVIFGSTSCTTGGGTGPCAAPSGTLTIAICGNKFVNQAGQTVVLRGANAEGTQYDCAQSGLGFYDDATITPGTNGGPGNYATEIAALKTWGINVVRVNLNEECWLGINGVPSTTSTKDTNGYNNYANEMGAYVNALNAAGIYAEVDLHLNAPGTELIADAGNDDFQNPLPESNSDTFWKSVGTYFANNHAVIFGVFNEPFPPNPTVNGDSTTGWNCDVNGCTVPDYSKTSNYNSVPSTTYAGVGMKQLITDIRSVNTTTPLLVGGPDFAGDMDDWLSTFYPGGKSIDPDNQLAASVHIYFPASNSPCSVTTSVTTACPSPDASAITQVAAVTPVLIDELGDFGCVSKSLTPFLTSIDSENASAGTDIGWVGWAWTTSSCDPTMITDFTSGAPSPMGEAFYCELLNSAKVAKSTFSSDCNGVTPK